MSVVFARTALVFATLLVTLIGASPAFASFETGLGATQYLSSDPSTREYWFDRSVDRGAGVVSITVDWNVVATRKPTNPGDPADSAYDFAALDGAVRDATSRGLIVMLAFGSAPGYAEGAGSRSGSSGGWKVDAGAFGDFVQAVANRYSGGYGGLPAVRYYDVWPEANLETHLAPQFAGKRPVAVARYRRMTNAVAAAVHAVSPANRVVVGSLAPYGNPPGGDRMRPVSFLRKLFCLTGGLERRRCPAKTHVDVLGHHPINQSGPPTQHALNPNDAASADLDRIRRVLRAAEREDTIGGPDRRHPLWATEFWWSDNLSDGTQVSERKQARWTAESLYLFWKAGARVAVYLPFVDSEGFFAGLYRENREPKPAARAFGFPFVVHGGGAGLRAWGRAPQGGRLEIERRSGGGWRAVRSAKVRAGGVFDLRLSVSGPVVLRATIGGQHSLPWRQGS